MAGRFLKQFKPDFFFFFLPPEIGHKLPPCRLLGQISFLFLEIRAGYLGSFFFLLQQEVDFFLDLVAERGVHLVIVMSCGGARDFGLYS